MSAFAVFASGSGTNLQRFIDGVGNGTLQGALALVVSDRPGCLAIRRAQEAGIAVYAFDPSRFTGKVEYECVILDALRARGVDIIFLAGYMRLVGPTLLRSYHGRIFNVHPSLLPEFRGRDAIRRALQAGVSETGVTIHLVDQGMDTGPVIAQETVPILPHDSEETLAARIHTIEHRLYPAVAERVLRLSMPATMAARSVIRERASEC